MNLVSQLRVEGTRIEYAFDPRHGVHRLWISASGETTETTVAGHVISALQPYRDRHNVQELVRWLSGFNLDGGWCPRDSRRGS